MTLTATSQKKEKTRSWEELLKPLEAKMSGQFEDLYQRFCKQDEKINIYLLMKHGFKISEEWKIGCDLRDV